jgi:hypothetical protein
MQMELLAAVTAPANGGNPLDHEAGFRQFSPPRTGFETEFHRLRQNVAQLPDFESDRNHLPSFRIVPADIDNALGDRHFVQGGISFRAGLAKDCIKRVLKIEAASVRKPPR